MQPRVNSGDVYCPKCRNLLHIEAEGLECPMLRCRWSMPYKDMLPEYIRLRHLEEAMRAKVAELVDALKGGAE